jgi:diaminohydroxyphosphoribosylaminopyrimidine deaminase/5-amino-6-(5-phosphoribosylamino)uracil reductase
MVGAVLVSADHVIADGWHAGFGDAHAEIDALARAEGRTRGATMYVSLEPCIHHGKTPPCADAVIASRVARVVVATRDPNPLARGGIDRLRADGIRVDVGVEADAACELNAAFFNSFASDRPWVTVKLAMSADGAIADPSGKRRWITGEESRREVHLMRANVDAVAVGIGTVLADDPMLNVRFSLAPRRQPTRVIFDSHLRTPLGADVVLTASVVPTIIVAGTDQGAAADALRSRGVEIIAVTDLSAALQALRARDIRSVLVEGGARLAGSFLREKAADRIAIFQSPLRLEKDALAAFSGAPDGTGEWVRTLPVVDRRTFGEDTLITYAVREVPCSPA